MKKKVIKDEEDQYEKENSENKGLGKHFNLKMREFLKNIKKKLKYINKILTNKDGDNS